ncbi:hypothetical protein EHP00_1394 [Ecytonucleospora hepatopenaei]|uniref:Uncharacterized protein n=1 Tax=Ecytonucleospora hepatopenaei TaxID=646526 RepID=A0A1W0E8W9_9MICR|nr:hypothetical protein EHP00_1394 [Ecytonucleospora hepatopenaei]
MDNLKPFLDITNKILNKNKHKIEKSIIKTGKLKMGDVLKSGFTCIDSESVEIEDDKKHKIKVKVKTIVKADNKEELFKKLEEKHVLNSTKIQNAINNEKKTKQFRIKNNFLATKYVTKKLTKKYLEQTSFNVNYLKYRNRISHKNITEIKAIKSLETKFTLKYPPFDKK